MSVSIIIPAFKADAFINECIDSIEKQKVSFDFEILIGIDGCDKTLEHLKKNAYGNENLRIFYFQPGQGPYIIKNSLMDECKYEHVLFFDADDIMLPETLSIFNNLIQKHDLVKLPYQDFYHRKPVHKGERIKDDATFGVRKSKFEKMNGFYPWICSADTEFVKRATTTNKWSHASMPGVAYHRRLHGANLTMDPRTNYTSSIRMSYDNEIKRTPRLNPQSKTTQPYIYVKNINASV